MKEKIAEIVEQLCIVCPSEITCGFDAREKATQAILALIEQEQKHFDWVAEHLTRIRISMTGNRMEIEYIDSDGKSQELCHEDPECEESYPEMLHKAIDTALKGVGR